MRRRVEDGGADVVRRAEDGGGICSEKEGGGWGG